jgi:hypothetical protein
MRNVFRCVLALMLVVGVARSAAASSIVFVDSHGSAVRITDIGGGFVTVELANFGPGAVVPVDVLTAVLFNGVNLNPTEVSAWTGASATLVGDITTGCNPLPPGGVCPSGSSLNVGGEYGGEVINVGVYDYGISSTGAGGVFGQPNFNGPNITDPVALDGGQFGIVSAINGLALNAQPGVLGEPLIKGVVTFTLSGMGMFNPATAITGVAFNYGTNLNLVVGTPNVGPDPFSDDPGVPAPEPATLIMLGSGLAFIARSARKKFRK